jgi:hypothetical protein
VHPPGVPLGSGRGRASPGWPPTNDREGPHPGDIHAPKRGLPDVTGPLGGPSISGPMAKEPHLQGSRQARSSCLRKKTRRTRIVGAGVRMVLCRSATRASGVTAGGQSSRGAPSPWRAAGCCPGNKLRGFGGGAPKRGLDHRPAQSWPRSFIATLTRAGEELHPHPPLPTRSRGSFPFPYRENGNGTLQSAPRRCATA